MQIMSRFALRLLAKGKSLQTFFRKHQQSGLGGHKENRVSALFVKGLERKKHFVITLSHNVFISHAGCSHNQTNVKQKTRRN